MGPLLLPKREQSSSCGCIVEVKCENNQAGVRRARSPRPGCPRPGCPHWKKGKNYLGSINTPYIHYGKGSNLKKEIFVESGLSSLYQNNPQFDVARRFKCRPSLLCAPLVNQGPPSVLCAYLTNQGPPSVLCALLMNQGPPLSFPVIDCLPFGILTCTCLLLAHYS